MDAKSKYRMAISSFVTASTRNSHAGITALYDASDKFQKRLDKVLYVYYNNLDSILLLRGWIDG